MIVLAASTVVWIFIVVPLVIIWALGVVDIFRSHRSGWTTAGWLLIGHPAAGDRQHRLLDRAQADREGDQARSRQARAEQPERPVADGSRARSVSAMSRP